MNNYLNFNIHKQVTCVYRDTSKMLAPAGGRIKDSDKPDFGGKVDDAKDAGIGASAVAVFVMISDKLGGVDSTTEM